MKKESKKAQQFLTEETLKIVIAILCIIVLIYLGVRLYGMFINDEDISKEEISKGEVLEINEEVEFLIGGEIHHIKLISISDEYALFSIQSEAIEVELILGEEIKVDVNKDGFYDLKFRLIGIDSEGKNAMIDKKEIHEKIIPTLNKYEQAVFVNQEEALKIKIKQFEERYSNQTEEKPEVEDEIKNAIHPEWIEKLSTIPKPQVMPYVQYDWEDGVACGATSVYQAFHQFGREVNPNEINRKKSNFFGNIFRDVLSIFNEEASLITWPWEIKKMVKSFGYEVEVYSGKEATKQLIIDKVGKDSAVIYRSYLHEISGGNVVPKPVTTLFGIKMQHYQYFDYEGYIGKGLVSDKAKEYIEKGVITTERKYFDQLPENSIREVYVIKKPTNK